MCYISHLVVGDFVLAPTVKTIEKVTVGQPVGIHCPSHKKSYNVKYKWEYQQALERVTLPPSRRYFVSENGTLYFSFLESKDVTYINSLSGIHCKQQAIVDGQEMALNSHQITLSEDTKTITGTVWSVDALNKKCGGMQRIAHAKDFACVVVQIWYTAISINVVGKRRQAYTTRPKRSMGRNHRNNKRHKYVHND